MSNKNRGPEPDLDKYIRYLEETDPLREQINLDIVKALNLPKGSSGLDVGCGMGTQSLMLADTVGPEGHVTGLDIKPEFLVYAREVIEKKGMSKRVSFKEGDFYQLPFDDDTFDWVWSSDCIGYIPPTKEVTRVIKPGGSLNIAFWSSEQLLPGYPLLELKLKATTAGLAPFVTDGKPETHYLRTLAKLSAAGLKDLQAATFVQTVHAPLSAKIYTAMTDILEMRWPNVEPELSKEDFALYKRLTDPGSPDFILNLPDYYGFYTYSVFKAK
ncbi:class I SAM-dependent methyltransferase [Chloroflexota bacterium]